MGFSAKGNLGPNGSIFESVSRAALTVRGKAKVNELRCADHGGTVTVSLSGDLLTFSGWCCEKFRMDAAKFITQK